MASEDSRPDGEGSRSGSDGGESGCLPLPILARLDGLVANFGEQGPRRGVGLYLLLLHPREELQRELPAPAFITSVQGSAVAERISTPGLALIQKL